MSENRSPIDAVLVAWSPAEDTAWTQAKSALSQAAQVFFAYFNEEEEPPSHDLVDELGQEMLGEDAAARLVYGGRGTSAVEDTVRRAIDEGAEQVMVVPLIFTLETLYPAYAKLGDMRARLSGIEALHPGVEILFVGPPFDQTPQIEGLAARIREYEPEGSELLQDVIARGFKDDQALFALFMKKLQEALPADARVVLRGSTLTGQSYTTGRPFDARSPGTSDIDITIVSEESLVRWAGEGFYIPGILAIPVSDENPHFAPWLNPARVELQRMVERPVTIQAMTQWFLDLRTALLNTPYLFLDA